MPLKAIYAQLSCTKLDGRTEWFTWLFGRGPDSEPMRGLAEWHYKSEAGFQLFENSDNAGSGTLTLVVDDIEVERDRLAGAGLQPGEIGESRLHEDLSTQRP